MKNKLFGAALLSAGICAAGTSHAQAGSYQFIDLGPGSVSGMNDLGQVIGQTSSGATLWNGSTASLLSNPVYSGAHAINDAGLVAGDALENNSHFIPVLWNGSTQIPLQVGASGHGEANGINASGQVVGDANGTATIWTNGVPSSLTVGVSSNLTSATAINNAGQAVGYVQLNNGATYGVLWNGSGNGTLLSTLGGGMSNPFAINNAGVAVGVATNAAGTMYATEWHGNTATQLAVLAGTTSSNAFAINDAGVIVGRSTDTRGYGVATLWDGNNVINLNNYLNPSVRQAGWLLENAISINQNGWIVGDAQNLKTGASEAFELQVLNPVPEADTWAMLLAGLGLIGASLRRKRQSPSNIAKHGKLSLQFGRVYQNMPAGKIACQV